MIFSWICLAGDPAAAALDVIVDGRPMVVVRHAGSHPAERRAAEEIADYLEQMTGHPVRLESTPGSSSMPATTPLGAIWVGPVGALEQAGLALDAPLFDGAPLQAEEWIVASVPEGLVVTGGSPRGTLYAAARLIERHFGVRWWNPFEQHVPSPRRLTLGRLGERGRPAFGYRVLSGLTGPPPFRARSRLNGHQARLSDEWGGHIRFGAPHTHTFFKHIPPERHFHDHPEFFSEFGELRYADETQLCLTNAELLDRYEQVLRDAIERDRRRYPKAQRPRIYSVSQNDWGRPCGCDVCSRLVEQQGGAQSGPVLAFVNALARRLSPDYPDVLLETLAYHYTLEPPTELRAEPNVIVRVAGLHQRDYARGVRDPANRRYRRALEGWVERAERVWVWDYGVLFGEFDDGPLPNVHYFADDLRFYRDLGIGGVYSQFDFPVGSDLRDLKVWVYSRLLENPDRNPKRLIREFTDGFYGPAAAQIRAYLELRRRAALRHGAIDFDFDAADLDYLTPRFLQRANRLLDRAERRVAALPPYDRRLRHARLVLDRATLHRWPLLFERTEQPERFGLARQRIEKRYRQAWREQIGLRVPAGDQIEWIDWVDWEIGKLRFEASQAAIGQSGS